MPGLLQADASTTAKFWAAVAAEFLGTFLFAFFGGAASPLVAAWANGIGLAVLVYVTANISGGHLNPAVTLATLITGHTSIQKGLLYMAAQVAAAALAGLVQMALIPGAVNVGCFAPNGITLAQAFGWEALMTFLLVVTIYSVAVGEPSFGVVGPLAIGLALFTAAITGGGYTGASLNPARLLGPALVFNCHWDAVPAYLAGQVLGGVAGALVSWPLYGTGLQLGRWAEELHDKLEEARHAVTGSAAYERLQGSNA